jgi:hypothetical protein
MKFDFFSYFGNKILSIKLKKKSVKWETPDGRTDMTTLIVAFHNFANAPKIEFYIEIYRLFGFYKMTPCV